MASNQAIAAFLNAPPPNPALATRAVTPGAHQRAQQRQTPSPQLKAQVGAQIDQQKAQEKAAQAAQRQANIQQSADLRQQNLDIRKAQEHRLETGQQVRAVQGLADLAEKGRDLGSRVEAWASNVRTPGGIGLLLLAIFILLWAVVPVNGGKTRGQLFWLTLTGRTRMAASPDAGGTYTDPASSGSGTGSGGIGSGGNGHSTTATADLLSQLSIRDFGSSGV